MILQIIAESIVGFFSLSLAVFILCIRNLLALRKEWREFDETRKREAQLLSELDAFEKRVTEWINQNPRGSIVGDPSGQRLINEALHLQMRVRELDPDYDGGDKAEWLLSVIDPKGAA